MAKSTFPMQSGLDLIQVRSASHTLQPEFRRSFAAAIRASQRQPSQINKHSKMTKSSEHWVKPVSSTQQEQKRERLGGEQLHSKDQGSHIRRFEVT